MVVIDRIFVDALDSEYHGLESCCFVRFQREVQTQVQLLGGRNDQLRLRVFINFVIC